MSLQSFNRSSFFGATITIFIIGVTLSYFNLETYLIIAGFRFHIASIIILLFLLRSGFITAIKSELLKPTYNKKWGLLLLLVLSVIVSGTVVYFLVDPKIADPDYFYEFGLSSIIDYPIYLVWNLPQLLLFYLFWRGSIKVWRNKSISVVIIILISTVMLIYEILPPNRILENGTSEIIIDYLPKLLFILYISGTIIFIKLFPNFYLFATSFFTIPWITYLVIGTESKTIINLLYAAQYTRWEGFFELETQYRMIFAGGIILFFLISFIIYSLIKMRNSNLVANEEVN
jgi:hypothetical protein